MKAAVKIMRSYNYCHFETCLSSDEDMTLEQVDEMRKEAARLTDKAVEQYKQAREFEDRRSGYNYRHRISELEKEVAEFANVPDNERTPEMKAKAKYLADLRHWMSREYDYEDDFEDTKPPLVVIDLKDDDVPL
jgi:hypothetical protein